MGDSSPYVEDGSLTATGSYVKVGVLAVQGDFAEHKYHLEEAARSVSKKDVENVCVEVVEVRRPDDLEGLVGLIIPGGESTTMGHFLQRNSFEEKLKAWMKGGAEGAPIVWGTCAGLILLSDRLMDQKEGGQCIIGGLDITSVRNMYGRQQASFEAPLTLHNERLDDGSPRCHGVFIRAPGIKSVEGNDVHVLATHTHGEITSPVAVESGNLLASSFHPELTDDLRWHRYFLMKILCRGLTSR